MKAKVESDESLAQAYGDMAVESRSIDDEITAALESGPAPATQDSLAELKRKMGLLPSKEQEGGGAAPTS